ncbi:hypothetical protein [Halalkalibacter urbisdiaboli]|uniref:hypothetical protein n=1 Tax=Halalkalibacter urbisdiaboli TaxID=1960589 RepID=UPI000B4302DA|nr:hypothetical protein [Halalkalibacter urbisdiaboli]
MTNEEMVEKIDKLQTGKSNEEIFDRLRPPEEFGDAVKLTYNLENESFHATVFDPQTKTIYSEIDILEREHVLSFIKKTVN